MFKNAIARLVASLLLTVLVVGEAGAEGFAPLNPEYKKWRKQREITSRVADSKKAPLLKSANQQALPTAFGYMPSVLDRSYLRNINASGGKLMQRAMGFAKALKESYDLRALGQVTSVKDQNPYGTCWAHATMASMESCLLKSTGITYAFSEKHLANTHGWDLGFDDGGNVDMAAGYLTRWSGPIAESEDPYPDESFYDAWLEDGGDLSLGALKVSPSPIGSPLGHVQQVYWIPPMSGSQTSSVVMEELVPIKQALMDYGALYVDYKHVDSCYRSVDGYKDTYYLPADYDGKASGHAVTIVGWNDNFPKGSFKETPPGNGAFIVKNSWNTWFGINGYFYVSYYDKCFAKQDLAAFANLEPIDNYSRIYQHDPLGMTNAYNPVNGNSAWGANIFTAVERESLGAVGFYALSPNTKYTLKVYGGCSTANSQTAPITGTLLATQSGTVSSAGYVTVPLKSENRVEISKGQKFAIVLQLTTPGYNYPLAIEGLCYTKDGYENKVPATSAATASAGESYMSSNGTTWWDLATCFSDGSAYNFCCKAYMLSATAQIILSDVQIEGEGTLLPGKAAQFTCKAKYSDGSDADVTKKAHWSIASGAAYASVEATTGLVTAKSVNERQTVKVHAEYTEGGVTESDDWSFYVTIASPEPPSDLKATEGDDASCVRLYWTPPEGATYYSVHRSVTSDPGNAKCIASKITDHQYFDTGEDQIGEPMIPGKDYYYFVKAGNAAGYNKNFSNGAMGWRKLSAPETVNASDGTSLDYVLVKWTDVAGANYYHVYRSDEIEGEKEELGSWQTDTQYEDKTAEPGVTYYYYVVAAVDSRGNRPSDYSIIEDGYRGVPVVPVGLEIIGESSIPSGGNRTYSCTVIKSDDTREENVAATWSLATTKAARLSGSKIYAYDVTENTKVVLTAAYGSLRQDLEVTITAVKPDPPTSLTLLSADEKGVYFQWVPVLGAAGYKIYRHDGTTEKVIAEINDGEAYKYTDKTAVPGVKYTYRISSWNSAGEGNKSSKSLEVTIGLAAPTGVMATSDDSAQVTVSWQKVAGATYYRVYRAESQTGTKTALGSWQTAFTYPDKGGTAGKEYYYFVCGATTSMGANAGPFSEGVVGKRPVAVTLSSIAITGGGTKVASGGKMTLSCLATYSDKTEKTVTPNWNVSPTTHASIDAAGQFTAKSVTTDQKVTVTASFGGKTDKREIKIIAPVVASAKVSNVKATSRWPFSNLLDVDYELQTTPEGTRAAIALSGYDNDRRVAMAAHTLSGDGADGSVAAGKRRLTWDVATDYPDFRSSSLDVELTAVAITVTAPTDLTASSGTSSGGVNLSWTGVEDVTEYEIWRGTSSVSSAAAKIRSVEATSYLDSTAVAGTTYYYWVKAVSPDGISDFSKAVSGSRPYANVVIKFNGNGGTASPSQLTLTPGEAYGTLPTATRLGYSLDGWYTAASGGTKIIATSIVPTSATELFAHWKANTYTVTLNKNGGTCTDLTSYTYGVGATLPTPTKTGNTFGGWFTTSSCTGTAVTKISPTDTGDKVFYAKWTVNTYTVTLNKNGGTCADLTSYTYGVGATLPTPTKAGNTFGGWFTTSACTGTAVTKISTTDTGNKAFYAKWTGISYTIAFNANGGSGTMANLSMVYGTAKNLTANAFTKTGYTFTGWATSSTGAVVHGNGVSVNNLTATSGATVTLYAKWTPNTYTVTLNKNGGTCTDLTSYTYGVGATLPTPTKAGNTFGGWFTTSACTGTAVTKISTTDTGDKVFYAKWTPNTYTVTLNKNGGTCADLTSYTYGVGATLPTPTKAGNTFGGWFTTSACTGTAVTKISTTDTGNKVFYAKWTGISYTIAFNANGGSGTMSNISMVYGTAKNLTANAFTKTGHTFAGWATSSTGSVVYGNGVSVNNLTATSGATVTLYAKWTANSYTIAFNANGGSGTMSNLSMVYGTAKNLTANAFAKTGYTFAGWATSSTGSVVYGNGVSVNNLTATSGATVTFYAKWTVNTYTVTLNKNGGTCADLTSYTYGVGATLPTPTKAGNTFGGWFTTSACTGTAVTKISTIDTGNKVFYAKWTPNTYTVTLNKNGGTCADLTSYTYGVGATLPTPTRADYVFVGWFETANFSGTAVAKILATDTGAKVFYAKWEERVPQSASFNGSAPNFEVLNGPEGVLLQISNTISADWWSADSCKYHAYKIYHNTSSDQSTATLLATVMADATNSQGVVCYTNTTISVGVKQWYWVVGYRARRNMLAGPSGLLFTYSNETYTSFPSAVMGYRRLPDPDPMAPTVTRSGNQITVSWTAVAGADQYAVYRVFQPTGSGSIHQLEMAYWNLSSVAEKGFTKEATNIDNYDKVTSNLGITDVYDGDRRPYYYIRAMKNGTFSNRSARKTF